MLVLSRKINEKIVIDGGIVVTVVKIEGGQVRLGIEAPSDVKVYREELLVRKAAASHAEEAALAGV
ncbi:carbon storage regulator CsrA [Paludisphaera mucosa]|uniref:Translational regulator CsrA n=1 Tax=Paludisphaera mucosa TaxID=3030827 RepID=A0ABT6F8H9_9BACT|nr:carbon storage regulator CsrA [Paludisphaera mucosa]MDG3003812.1 carbon storage regulator CsrA [Paludisphaera mucosa]